MNTIFSIMGENMIEDWAVSDAILLVVCSPKVKFFYAESVPSWFLLNLKVVQVT